MPIIIPKHLSETGLSGRLDSSNTPTLTEAEAERADIRPARIGILNLMPAKRMKDTEAQWLRYIGRHMLQIYPVLIRFDDDWRMRSGASGAGILEHYTPFSEVQDSEGLDGLIITGANLETIEGAGGFGRQLRPFDDILYDEELKQVIDWANNNVSYAIYSCLAAHRALNHFYGLERELRKTKLLGVYTHKVVSPESPFMRDMDDELVAPHSRWGDIPTAAMQTVGDITLLALNEEDEVGWFAASRPNDAGGHDLFQHGHLEYNPIDLSAEAARDRIILPESYFNAKRQPRRTWLNGARAHHGNWIEEIHKNIAKENQH